MAIKEDVRARAPRGTKNVTQAFFEALEGIPESQQKAVATAALASIRDDLKAQRLKTKETAAKAKAKAPAKKKASAKKAAAPRSAKATKAPKPAPAAARKQAAAKKAPAKKAAPAKTAKTAKRKSPRTVVSPAPAPEAATE